MKSANGFGLNEINEQTTFSLDQKPDANAVARARLQVGTIDNQVANNVNTSAQDDVVHLDIDNVDLVKLQSAKPTETLNKGQLEKFKAYKNLHGFFKIRKGINIKEKENFYELISVMLEAGISLTQALTIYKNQTTDKHMQKICQSISWQLEKGQSFSQALGDFDNIFSESEIGIISAAEVTGRLTEALKRLASDVEKQAAIRRKLVSAMIYPAIVILFVIVTLFTLLKFVVPQISGLFLESGMELPALTIFVVNTSQFVVENTTLLVLGFVIIIGLNIIAYRIPKGRYIYHYLSLKIPVIKDFQRDIAQANFSNSLSNLVSSGVQIVQALQITANSLGNLVYRRNVHLLAKDVANGIQIADSLRNSPYFSEMLISMVSVGERTAQLDSITAKLAYYYGEKVGYLADNLTKLLQPFIIAVVGLIVGIVVLAIMLPMSQLIGAAGV